MQCTCPVCGVEFERTKNAQKFCSAKCRRKYTIKLRNANTIKVLQLCGYCGRGFHAKTKRKYCCKDCRLAANGRKKLGVVVMPPQKDSLTLQDVARLSREEGLSYGQYVQKYNLK